MAANLDAIPHPSVMRLPDINDVMVLEKRNYDFPWGEGIFKDCLRAGYVAQVLRLDLLLVGYGVMQVAADEAHILNLCIDREFNHRGYARLLLERLLSMAEHKGAHIAFLEARHYYESADGREDAIVMAKTLGAG